MQLDGDNKKGTNMNFCMDSKIIKQNIIKKRQKTVIQLK